MADASAAPPIPICIGKTKTISSTIFTTHQAKQLHCSVWILICPEPPTPNNMPIDIKIHKKGKTR